MFAGGPSSSISTRLGGVAGKVGAGHLVKRLPDTVAGLLAEPAGNNLRAVEHLLDVADRVGVFRNAGGEGLHIEVHGLEGFVELNFSVELVVDPLLGSSVTRPAIVISIEWCGAGGGGVVRVQWVKNIKDSPAPLFKGVDARSDGVAEELDILCAVGVELL